MERLDSIGSASASESEVNFRRARLRVLPYHPFMAAIVGFGCAQAIAAQPACGGCAASQVQGDPVVTL